MQQFRAAEAEGKLTRLPTGDEMVLNDASGLANVAMASDSKSLAADRVHSTKG